MVIFNVLAQTPFGILSDWTNTTSDTGDFVNQLGLPQLGVSLTLCAMWAAICTFIGSLMVLSIIQNPKMVSQTKTKIVATILITAVVAVLPFLFDVAGGLVNEFILR